MFGFSEIGEEEYFLRNPEGLNVRKEKFIGADLYIEQALNDNSEVFRSDSLFLTGAALNGNKIATSVRNEIRSLILVDGVKDESGISFAFDLFENGTDLQRKELSNLLRAADTGIEEIKLSDLPEALIDKKFLENQDKVSTKNQKPLQTFFSRHGVYNEEGKLVNYLVTPFSLWESDGTYKLLGIAALI